MLTISTMTRADIRFAVRMTQIEMWSYDPEDIARLIEFEPSGCFVARINNRRVGMVSTTSYGRCAFLGMVIVRKSVRRRGVGEALIRAAIDYLHGIGVTTIELDAVFPAARLYRRFGFKDKYLSFRLCNPHATGVRRKIHRAQEVAGDVVRFDRAVIGIRRERVIKELLEVYPDSYCVLRNKKVTAYSVVKHRELGYLVIGPFVAADRRAAETLLSSLMGQYTGRPIVIGVPEINRDAVDLFLKNGFLHREPCIRMYLGRKRSSETGVYGIVSPEKG